METSKNVCKATFLQVLLPCEAPLPDWVPVLREGVAFSESYQIFIQTLSCQLFLPVTGYKMFIYTKRNWRSWETSTQTTRSLNCCLYCFFLYFFLYFIIYIFLYLYVPYTATSSCVCQYLWRRYGLKNLE